jgi:hypothetical protein
MGESGMDYRGSLWRKVITSCELGDEPSGSKKCRVLATRLETASFLTEAVINGINLVINHKASSGSNAHNYVFRLLGKNKISLHE